MKLQTEIIRNGYRYLVTTMRANGSHQYETFIYSLDEKLMDDEYWSSAYDNEDDAELGHEEVCYSWGF